MDWAGIILFVITILGAVAFSQGSLIGGFFAFLIIGTILAAIRELFKKFAATGDPIEEPTSTSANTRIVFGEEHFEHTLDMVMKFLYAYSAVVPEEWYILTISQEQKRTEYSERYYVQDGYLKFEVKLGCWWDTMLYQHPDLDDYMKSVFTFNPEDRTFTYSNFMTGQATCCAFPREEINETLQAYLDNYEAKHPGVRFERHSWGAQYIR